MLTRGPSFLHVRGVANEVVLRQVEEVELSELGTRDVCPGAVFLIRIVCGGMLGLCSWVVVVFDRGAYLPW